MLIKTDLSQVKDVAHTLLMVDLHKTPYSPMVVQHPFTSSGIVALTRNGCMQPVDITANQENLSEWQSAMKRAIDNAESAYEIFSMVNKPFGLTFLKYAEPHLSKTDFSQTLSEAWMRSENPNCDVNVSKNKLVSLFKQAEPSSLMTDQARKRLDELDETVTVYRGLTSYNEKNIRALSWTLDYGKAEWFAHRFDEDGTVYEAQIGKRYILALFNGRNESEVIVDPKYLTEIMECQASTQNMTHSL